MIWILTLFFLDGDLVFFNGAIHTLDANQPTAKVLVTKSERIAFVGQEVPEHVNREDWTWIDLKGQTVIPGLTDAHAHLSSLGKSLDYVDLRGVESYPELIRKVVAFAKGKEAGSWILGRGWDQNLWPDAELPHHLPLTAALPERRVCLYRIDGHACLINAAAMDQCGLHDDMPDPQGGRLIRHDGKLTGVLVDHAMDLIQLPPPSVEDMVRWLRRASAYANRFGLTGVHDAGVDSSLLEAYGALAARGELTLRSYLMIDCSDEKALNRALTRGPQIGLNDGLITIRSIKALADGALGSRGAWLKKPYADDPGNCGLQTIGDNTFSSLLDRALARGFQVNTHAIGDQANYFVLEQIHRAHQRAETVSDTRFRIEHAQIVDPDDIPKFKQYGVVPSMQPTHCTSDMDWADERLGQSRLQGAYAWRSFLDLGLVIPMGSDFPVEKVNPFEGLYAAVSRQDLAGNPPDGFFPEQRLTRHEALLGFTSWAAFGAFQEHELGSLEAGKYADLVVIDRDYFSIKARDIANISVLMTVVGGKIVYRSL